jgi:hypothetical protein
VIIFLFITSSFTPFSYGINFTSKEQSALYRNKRYFPSVVYNNFNEIFDSEKYKTDLQSEGYTLFAPEYSGKIYLINIDGEIVHSWQSKYIQGLAVYLLDNGNLIRNCLPGINPTFVAGGITGRIEIFNWYEELFWEFEYFTDRHCLHHDFEVLPNGNILMIAWEYKTRDEAIAAGRDPDKIQSKAIWPDHIIEVEPTGENSGNIVWEWHVWDHLIQDFDSSKNNYGSVKDHPELIDINFGGSQADWLHTNSIDYNEDFDQIILSAHSFNEIWVIDHSTTTEEAAGHTGGKSGKGGDILYRWGNPLAYRAGSVDNQTLFGQHDAQWIDLGCPGEGNILVFNNGLKRPGLDYSSVDEIIPPVDEEGNYYYESGSPYGPEEPIWSYDDQTNFFSGRRSGAQRLTNGNTLICNGDNGVFFELTPHKQKIWEYINSYPNPVFNQVFKIKRYNPDYKGLEILINAPYKPNTPKGPSQVIKGEECTYFSITTDPQQDEIYYWFDWGDGSNSGWIGPYNSGLEGEASHIWEKNGKYKVKVKAKDINDYESLWSDSLQIFVPRNKFSRNFIISCLFLRLFKIFPILEKLIYI